MGSEKGFDYTPQPAGKQSWLVEGLFAFRVTCDEFELTPNQAGIRFVTFHFLAKERDAVKARLGILCCAD